MRKRVFQILSNWLIFYKQAALGFLLKMYNIKKLCSEGYILVPSNLKKQGYRGAL